MITLLDSPSKIDALAEAIATQHAAVLATKPRGWRTETKRLARLYRRTRSLKA